MAKYGLDRPLLIQCGRYLSGVAHGDFVPSLKYKDKTVAGIIAAGFSKSAFSVSRL